MSNASTEQYDTKLDEHIFESIEHAQLTATQWLWIYNAERPNMGLGGLTPYQKLAAKAA